MMNYVLKSKLLLLDSRLFISTTYSYSFQRITPRNAVAHITNKRIRLPLCSDLFSSLAFFAVRIVVVLCFQLPIFTPFSFTIHNQLPYVLAYVHRLYYDRFLFFFLALVLFSFLPGLLRVCCYNLSSQNAMQHNSTSTKKQQTHSRSWSIMLSHYVYTHYIIRCITSKYMRTGSTYVNRDN